MSLGLRVAIPAKVTSKDGDKYVTGTVVGERANGYQVRLDNGNLRSVTMDVAIPVYMFLDAKRPILKEDLVVSKHRDFYKQYAYTKTAKVGENALRGVWARLNKDAFNGSLREPTFAVFKTVIKVGSKSMRGAMGVFSYRGPGGSNTLSISQKMLTPKDNIQVILHEMVHQYQGEVLIDKRGQDMVGDWHGKSFTDMAKRVASLTGIKVSVKYTVDDIVEFISEKRLKKAQYVVVYENIKENKIFAAKLPSEKDAKALSRALKSGQPPNRIKSYVVSVDDATILGFLKSTTKGKGKVHLIPDSLSATLKKLRTKQLSELD